MMNLAPVYDMAIGIVVFMFASLGPLLLFLPAFLIEGAVLKELKNPDSPFVASFVMNLVTTLLGIPVGYGLTMVAFMGTSLFTGTSSHKVIQYGEHLFLSGFLVMLLSWLFSILVEGVILILGFNVPGKQGWRVSFWANSASYSAGFILVVVYFMIEVNTGYRYLR